MAQDRRKWKNAANQFCILGLMAWCLCARARIHTHNARTYAGTTHTIFNVNPPSLFQDISSFLFLPEFSFFVHTYLGGISWRENVEKLTRENATGATGKNNQNHHQELDSTRTRARTCV